MNQAQIGEFIAAMRKEKNLTQVELGDLLGVTNKTISRWENGNYMPDISIMQQMCSIFDIGINELISGKKLNDSDFKASADQNLISSLHELKNIRKYKRIIDFLSGSGTGLVLSSFYSPDSTRRSVVMAIGLIMIFLSWYFRGKFDKFVMNTLSVIDEQ
jgi:transcriptional regulator with XRE-family HTH domain